MHAMNNNQRAAKAMNKSCGTPLVPFAMLYPFIEPQLDKDRAMQLRGLYAGFRNRRISKVEFVRRVRTIVGDHMIKMAVYKFQTTRADKKLNRAHILKSNQQAPNAMNRPSRKKVPFAMLYPVLEPRLDKDSAMQLLGQYARFMV
ncbi:Histone-fold [Artemisia annua]|uniref:Histone-fold n=1 Tax=Artemisia annua TaxID=35608 RepID=A0A2U1KFQ7_ARTAN|nr:Histone-fold [Artemisia annua]